MIKVYVGNNISRKAVIVPEDTTLRTVLQDNDVDYSSGMTSLDGSTLMPGDMDKTFADFGITEVCYLLNTVKAVNAASIKILGTTAVVASDFTPEQVAELCKYRPAAVTIVDPETKEVDFMACNGSGNGRVTIFGVEFGTGTTSDGKAIATINLPDGVDAKEYVVEKYGSAITHLRALEAKWADALEEIAAEKAAILDTIEVL